MTTESTPCTLALPIDQLEQLRMDARSLALQYQIDLSYTDLIRAAVCRTYNYAAPSDVVSVILNHLHAEETK